MADQTLDLIMEDLNYAVESGELELGYRRHGDRIVVEQYSDDGSEITVVGYLTFRKAGN